MGHFYHILHHYHIKPFKSSSVQVDLPKLYLLIWSIKTLNLMANPFLTCTVLIWVLKIGCLEQNCCCYLFCASLIYQSNAWSTKTLKLMTFPFLTCTILILESKIGYSKQDTVNLFQMISRREEEYLSGAFFEFSHCHI